MRDGVYYEVGHEFADAALFTLTTLPIHACELPQSLPNAISFAEPRISKPLFTHACSPVQNDSLDEGHQLWH
jgi:hypothetical protein